MSLRALMSHFWSENAFSIARSAKMGAWFSYFFGCLGLLLLIERSPADLWITVLALTFIIRATIKRDFRFTSHFWVKACFAYWGTMFLSSLLSVLPVYSLGEAFIWIRFPLFAMATMFWLGTDKDFLYAMGISTALGLIVMWHSDS